LVKMKNATAIILAGGHSSRMGTAKAGLLFDGVPLLEHLCGRLAELFPEIVVVRAAGQAGAGDDRSSRPFDLPPVEASACRYADPGAHPRVVEDAVPDQGPVAGICAGLEAARHPLAFVVSCDVPFLNPHVGAMMVDLAEGVDVVVPEWEGRLHPLQAVYRTRVGPLLLEQLAAGRRRPVDLYERVPVRKVTEEEIRAVDPLGLTFMNMNTPEDYQRALALWNEERA
jgi:molybdenum cofactor guanylyltransferase